MRNFRSRCEFFRSGCETGPGFQKTMQNPRRAGCPHSAITSPAGPGLRIGREQQGTSSPKKAGLGDNYLLRTVLAARAHRGEARGSRRWPNSLRGCKRGKGPASGPFWGCLRRKTFRDNPFDGLSRAAPMAINKPTTEKREILPQYESY